MCLREQEEPLLFLCFFVCRLLATLCFNLDPDAWEEAIWANTHCSGLGLGPPDACCCCEAIAILRAALPKVPDQAATIACTAWPCNAFCHAMAATLRVVISFPSLAVPARAGLPQALPCWLAMVIAPKDRANLTIVVTTREPRHPHSLKPGCGPRVARPPVGQGAQHCRERRERTERPLGPGRADPMCCTRPKALTPTLTTEPSTTETGNLPKRYC